MKEAKAFAFTIILMMMVVNFVVPKPVVPTLPHRSWDWLTPWPVQAVEKKVAKGESIQDINEKIILALMVMLAGEFLENFLELNTLLFDLWRDWAPSLDTGGGGGGETCQACDF
jgi:hypothetical protein